MAGHQIALLRILRLKDAFQATVTSTEFKDLKMFQGIAYALLQDELWQFLFVMCRALYAPMRTLRLADQKIPAMDKLYFYVLKSERMIEKWIKVAEEKYNELSSGLLHILRDTADVASEVIISDDEDSDDDGEEEVSWLQIHFHSTTNEQITEQHSLAVYICLYTFRIFQRKRRRTTTKRTTTKRKRTVMTNV